MKMNGRGVVHRLLAERCQHANGIADAVSPLAAVNAHLSVSGSLFIHDRLRDALLWRVLVHEHPANAAACLRVGTCKRSDSLGEQPGPDMLDPGPLLPSDVAEWMERVYAEQVTPAAEALVAASPPPQTGRRKVRSIAVLDCALGMQVCTDVSAMFTRIVHFMVCSHVQTSRPCSQGSSILW